MTDPTDTDSQYGLRGMEIIRTHFLNMVKEADSLTEVARQISIRLGRADDPYHVAMEGAEYGLDALSSATVFLNAAVNSLQALRLLTVQEIRNVDGALEIQLRITVNGTAGLIRQIVECAARALWLTSSTHPAEISLRGFAALWANAEEAVVYAKAIGSPESREKEDLLLELLEVGRSRSWINEGGRKPKPTIALSGATDILMKVNFDSGPLKPALALMGNNVENGEWVYRWLSGVAHGYVWVHSFKKVQPREAEMELAEIKPDWVRMTLSLTLAVHLIHRAMESLGERSHAEVVGTQE